MSFSLAATHLSILSQHKIDALLRQDYIGALQATVPGKISIVGTPTELHGFEISEEYLRALSSQNYIQEKKYNFLTHIYTYTRSYPR